MAKWNKIQDITVKTGSYKDRDGKEKNRYENVGQVLQSDDGGKLYMLKKTFNPAGVPDEKGGEFIIMSLFDVKEKQPTQHDQQKSNGYQPQDDDTEIPFAWILPLIMTLGAASGLA